MGPANYGLVLRILVSIILEIVRVDRRVLVNAL